MESPRTSERFWLVDVNAAVAVVALAAVQSAHNFNPVHTQRQIVHAVIFVEGSHYPRARPAVLSPLEYELSC